MIVQCHSTRSIDRLNIVQTWNRTAWNGSYDFHQTPPHLQSSYNLVTSGGNSGSGVFNDSSAAFSILTELLERFVEGVEDGGAVPVVGIFPDKYSVRRSQAGKRGICDPLVDFCKSNGIHYWDASDAFREAHADRYDDTWFRPNGHYSPGCNRFLAAWLGKRIKELVNQPDGE